MYCIHWGRGLRQNPKRKNFDGFANGIFCRTGIWKLKKGGHQSIRSSRYWLKSYCTLTGNESNCEWSTINWAKISQFKPYQYFWARKNRETVKKEDQVVAGLLLFVTRDEVHRDGSKCCSRPFCRRQSDQISTFVITRSRIPHYLKDSYDAQSRAKRVLWNLWDLPRNLRVPQDLRRRCFIWAFHWANGLPQRH